MMKEDPLETQPRRDDFTFAAHITASSSLAVGPGGGGAMYSPLVSPHDPSLMYVCCDMGGLYRSNDGGDKWTLLDAREVFVPTSIDRSVPPRLLPPRLIACHPNPGKKDWLLAVTFFRGLRFSMDQGAIWADIPTGVSDSQPWLSSQITALAVDPETGRLFVGTNDDAHYHDPDSAGVWDGEHWKTCDGVSGQVIAIVAGTSAAGTARHWLATRGSSSLDGEVLRSNDGGAKWTAISGNLPSTVGGRRRINDLAGGFRTSGGAILYVTLPSDTIGNVGGVYVLDAVSTSHWTRLTGSSGLPNTIGSGAVGVVQYECLSVGPDNADVAYVSAYNRGWSGAREFADIFRTVSGGQDWQSIWLGASLVRGWLEFDRPGFGGPPLALNMQEHGLSSGGKAATVVWTNKGSLIKATDSLESPTSPPTWEARYTKARAALAGPKQGWSSAGLEVTTAWQYYKDPHEPARRYAIYADIGFLRSDSSGAFWCSDSEIPSWRSNFYELAFDPLTPGTIWAAASDQHDLPYDKELDNPVGSGGILWSRDFGGTWTLRNSGLPAAPAVSVIVNPEDNRQLWASVYRFGVYKTLNGGESWAPSSQGLPSTSPLNVYRLHRHATGTLFCTLTGTGRRESASGRFLRESALFRSTNGAGSWERISEWLEYVMDYAVHPVDPNIIYLCTTGVRGADGAVRFTNDGGLEWSRVLGLQQMPDPPRDRFHAFAAWFHPRDPDIVMVSTNTHGIWTRRGSGAWSRFDGVPVIRTHRFYLDPAEPEHLFVSTHGAGVWDVSVS